MLVQKGVLICILAIFAKTSIAQESDNGIARTKRAFYQYFHPGTSFRNNCGNGKCTTTVIPSSSNPVVPTIPNPVVFIPQVFTPHPQPLVYLPPKPDAFKFWPFTNVNKPAAFKFWPFTNVNNPFTHPFYQYGYNFAKWPAQYRPQRTKRNVDEEEESLDEEELDDARIRNKRQFYVNMVPGNKITTYSKPVVTTIPNPVVYIPSVPLVFTPPPQTLVYLPTKPDAFQFWPFANVNKPAAFKYWPFTNVNNPFTYPFYQYGYKKRNVDEEEESFNEGELNEASDNDNERTKRAVYQYSHPWTNLSNDCINGKCTTTVIPSDSEHMLASPPTSFLFTPLPQPLVNLPPKPEAFNFWPFTNTNKPSASNFLPLTNVNSPFTHQFYQYVPFYPYSYYLQQAINVPQAQNQNTHEEVEGTSNEESEMNHGAIEEVDSEENETVLGEELAQGQASDGMVENVEVSDVNVEIDDGSNVEVEKLEDPEVKIEKETEDGDDLTEDFLEDSNQARIRNKRQFYIDAVPGNQITEYSQPNYRQALVLSSSASTFSRPRQTTYSRPVTFSRQVILPRPYPRPITNSRPYPRPVTQSRPRPSTQSRPKPRPIFQSRPNQRLITNSKPITLSVPRPIHKPNNHQQQQFNRPTTQYVQPFYTPPTQTSFPVFNPTPPTYQYVAPFPSQSFQHQIPNTPNRRTQSQRSKRNANIDDQVIACLPPNYKCSLYPAEHFQEGGMYMNVDPDKIESTIYKFPKF